MEDIDGIYRWVGPPLSDDSKRTQYPGILVQYKPRGKSGNDHLCLFKVGFHVLVHNADNLPYVAEIEDLYEDKIKKKMFAKLRWFYRYRDAKHHHKFVVPPHEREIFYSGHTDENDVSVIKAPCFVVFLNENQLVPLWERHLNNAFICRYELKFPGLAPIGVDKLRNEYLVNTPLFPAQLQQILLSDHLFWGSLLKTVYGAEFSIKDKPILPKLNSECEPARLVSVLGKTETLANVSSLLLEEDVKEESANAVSVANDEAKGEEIVEATVSNAQEMKDGDDDGNELYFSSTVPPTKRVRVHPFQFLNGVAAVRSTPLVEESSSTAAAEEVQTTTMTGMSEEMSDEAMDTVPAKKPRTDFELDMDDGIEYWSESVPTFFELTSPMRRQLSLNKPTGAVDAATPLYLRSSSPRPKVDEEKEEDEEEKKQEVASAKEGIQLFPLESKDADYFKVEEEKLEKRYQRNAADKIPPMQPLVESSPEPSDQVWSVSFDPNGSASMLALYEIRVLPTLQRVLAQSLKTYQQSLKDVDKLIVDGSAAFFAGIDVLALFHDCLFASRKPGHSSLDDEESSIALALQQMESILMHRVSVWSMQEQDMLYSLCRTPERKTHMISLPYLRVKRELTTKSQVEIIDFFEKFIGNGRYLDLVIPHEGFAYHLIHSDLTLEDSLAILPQIAGSKSSGRSLGQSNGQKSNVTCCIYSIDDSITSIEEEQLRRSLYWAEEDATFYRIHNQQDIYGPEFNVVDLLYQEWLRRRKSGKYNRDSCLPYVYLKDFDSKAYEKLEDHQADELVCQQFFQRLADVLDEFSFHQICCAMLLWQRTIISLGSLVVRISHILANSVVLPEPSGEMSVPQLQILMEDSLKLKSDLYKQFKLIVTSSEFHNFCLPHFESFCDGAPDL